MVLNKLVFKLVVIFTSATFFSLFFFSHPLQCCLVFASFLACLLAYYYTTTTITSLYDYYNFSYSLICLPSFHLIRQRFLRNCISFLNLFLFFFFSFLYHPTFFPISSPSFHCLFRTFRNLLRSSYRDLFMHHVIY